MSLTTFWTFNVLLPDFFLYFCGKLHLLILCVFQEPDDECPKRFSGWLHEYSFGVRSRAPLWANGPQKFRETVGETCCYTERPRKHENCCAVAEGTFLSLLKLLKNCCNFIFFRCYSVAKSPQKNVTILENLSLGIFDV